MGVLLILHFLPFWNVDGMSASIQSYVWYPANYSSLESFFAGQLGGEYHINSVVVMPIIVLIGTIAGIILCIFKV